MKKSKVCLFLAIFFAVCLIIGVLYAHHFAKSEPYVKYQENKVILKDLKELKEIINGNKTSEIISRLSIHEGSVAIFSSEVTDYQKGIGNDSEQILVKIDSFIMAVENSLSSANSLGLISSIAPWAFALFFGLMVICANLWKDYSLQGD